MTTTTLAIETSTHQGSIALLHHGAVLFSESCGAGRSHSSLLFGVLERALKAVPEGSRIDQIAVGLGPGSYAGVRIAIAAATGFAIATGAELIGIPSIAALAGGEYIALGDARRESYYFAHIRDGECLEGPTLFTATQWAEKIAGINLPILASEAIAGLEPAPAIETVYPSAERLAHLAIEGKSIIQRGNLEPIYLREPHITHPKKAATC